MNERGEARPWRVRLYWIAIALVVLTPLGVVGARQLAPSGDSPAVGSAQVVTQGIATLPGKRVAWRLVERTAVPRGQAKPVERDLGFVMASDEPILLTDRVAVNGDTKDVARLAPGESFLVKEGARQARASLSDRPVKYLALELVAATEVDEIGSGKLLYQSDPFTAPTGERDIDLVRNVLELGEQAFVPNTGESTVILATDGAIDILPEGGRARTLQAGESEQFEAGDLQIEAVANAAMVARRVPAAAMTDMLAQTATQVAAYVVAVIGEEIPPPPTPTPTETPTPLPTATSTPLPTETPVPVISHGSIAVIVYDCPPGMTLENVVGDTCPLSDGGYDFALTTPDGDELTLADAASDGSTSTWGELSFGQYEIVENALPDGYVDYFIPGSAAVGGSSTDGYTVAIDGSAPDILLTVYNFQPAQTGSIVVLVFDCPPRQVPNDFSPAACPPSDGTYDFRLAGPNMPDGITTADSTPLDGGFLWSDVPIGRYGLRETDFPDGYGQLVVLGSQFDEGLDGWAVDLSEGQPNITVAVFNFLVS